MGALAAGYRAGSIGLLNLIWSTPCLDARHARRTLQSRCIGCKVNLSEVDRVVCKDGAAMPSLASVGARLDAASNIPTGCFPRNPRTLHASHTLGARPRDKEAHAVGHSAYIPVSISDCVRASLQRVGFVSGNSLRSACLAGVQATF